MMYSKTKNLVTIKSPNELPSLIQLASEFEYEKGKKAKKIIEK